jgi:hypothetical protein
MVCAAPSTICAAQAARRDASADRLEREVRHNVTSDLAAALDDDT